MTDEPKELEVVLTPEVEAQVAADPKLKAFMQDFIAILHQARDAVLHGVYPTMDAAMGALMGSRPEKIDIRTGEPIEGASLHHDMGLPEPEEDE